MTVSKEVIARILTSFLALALKDKQLFHPKDVEMVQSNDWWIERFFIRNRTEEQVRTALIETMEWRKEFGIHDLQEDIEIRDRG